MVKTVSVPADALQGLVPRNAVITNCELRNGTILISFSEEEETVGFDPAIFDWLRAATEGVTSGRYEGESFREYMHEGHRC